MERKLHILIVDDEPVIHRTLGTYLTRSEHQVTANYRAEEAITNIKKAAYDLILLDLVLPGINGLELFEKIRKIDETVPVIIITGHGTMDVAIQALRLGAADFLPKPISLIELDAVIEKATRFGMMRKETKSLRQTIGGIQSSAYLREKSNTFIGTSQAAQQVRTQIHQAIEAQVNSILITGETGTGKEVVARTLHFMGQSEQAPFIAINCPSLTETLIEDELFGHEKGTFTNATTDRPGYFEMAHNGTLFLDEIGDLTLTLQATLLRVLDTRHIRRIGAKKEISINCKVIAATNVDLEQQIKANRFRNDLFYRLNVYHIHLPPLRDHPEDILPLAEHFLALGTQMRNRQLDGFSPEAQRRLQAYHYPGNVRELRNIIEQAIIFCKSGLVEHHHLNIGFKPIIPSSVVSASPPAPTETSKTKTIDYQTLVQALETTHWNRKEAARQLGITYAKLRYWIQRHNIT